MCRQYHVDRAIGLAKVCALGHGDKEACLDNSRHGPNGGVCGSWVGHLAKVNVEDEVAIVSDDRPCLATAHAQRGGAPNGSELLGDWHIRKGCHLRVHVRLMS